MNTNSLKVNRCTDYLKLEEQKKKKMRGKQDLEAIDIYTASSA